MKFNININKLMCDHFDKTKIKRESKQSKIEFIKLKLYQTHLNEKLSFFHPLFM